MERLEAVLQALNDVGLRAQRSYAPGIVPEVTAPLAVVALHSMEADALTLAVTLYCSPSLGGSLWEASALEALEALEALGASCRLEACGFDKELGLLSGRLLAAWSEAPMVESPEAISTEVSVDGAALPCLTGFSAEQTLELAPVGQVGAGTVFRRVEEALWTLTVEELLPVEAVPVENGSGSFTLTVTRPGGVEVFADCRWISTTRRETPQGVKQVRMARSWAERSIQNAEAGV